MDRVLEGRRRPPRLARVCRSPQDPTRPFVELSFAIVEGYKLVVDRKKLLRRDLPKVEHEVLEKVMALLDKASCVSPRFSFSHKMTPLLPLLSELTKRFTALTRICSPAGHPFAEDTPLDAAVAQFRDKVSNVAGSVEDIDAFLASRSKGGLPADLKRSFVVAVSWLTLREGAWERCHGCAAKDC